MIQDEESFVYLSALKALASLARLDAVAVTNQSIDVYQDHLEEPSSDARPRVGEAMQSIIQELGPALSQQAGDKLSNALLRTASRDGGARGQQPTPSAKAKMERAPEKGKRS